MATELMIDGRGDQSLRGYIDQHLSPGYVDSFADEAALLAHLRKLREAAAPVGGVGLTVDGSGLVSLHISNMRRKSVVTLRLDADDENRITELALQSSEEKEAGPQITWENLESELEAAEAKGFCGSVLAVRDGEVVLDRGYGYADPARQHQVTPNTLFAIGSTPIDFTHGAILKLEDMGKLSLDDPITRYFHEVPEDKRGITLEHLRTGASGLINFPGIEGVDENLDLSWIDRDEFMRRVMAAPLQFKPGTSEQHSHCAWGVLAAVIEIVSGQDYDTFLREHFFGPAKMDRTGNYPLSKQFPASEVAVGLGGNTWGEVNSPAHWGETSWLVLGSGGMVSTPGDLHRWRVFLRSGRAFGARAQDKYGMKGTFMAEGGNDRGFINTIGARGTTQVIMCSNSHVKMDDYASQLGMSLSRLVAQPSAEPREQSAGPGSEPVPGSPRMVGLGHLNELLKCSDDDLGAVLERIVSPAMFQSLGQEAVHGQAADLRATFATASRGGQQPEGPFSAKMMFTSAAGSGWVKVEVEDEPPHRIKAWTFQAPDAAAARNQR